MSVPREHGRYDSIQQGHIQVLGKVENGLVVRREGDSSATDLMITEYWMTQRGMLSRLTSMLAEFLYEYSIRCRGEYTSDPSGQGELKS